MNGRGPVLRCWAYDWAAGNRLGYVYEFTDGDLAVIDIALVVIVCRVQLEMVKHGAEVSRLHWEVEPCKEA